jgi:hypothetical protein
MTAYCVIMFSVFILLGEDRENINQFLAALLMKVSVSYLALFANLMNVYCLHVVVRIVSDTV